MALAPENLEWSLGVPSVKELIVVEQIETVPPRYIREDVADYPAPSDKPLPCVPLIDMAKLVELEHQEVELQKLHAACRDWGVFQVTLHTIQNTCLSLQISSSVEIDTYHTIQLPFHKPSSQSCHAFFL